MSGRREFLSEQARSRRRVAKCLAARNAIIQALKVRSAISQTRTILANLGFLAHLRSAHIFSIPSRLQIQIEDQHDSCQIDGLPDDFGDIALDFMVAWKFMSPLFCESTILEFIEAEWPGFVADMKDVFILMVTNGPFPHERKRTLRANFFL